MKTRLFFVIISIVAVAGVTIYFLIPSPLIAAGTVSFETSTNTAYRSLSQQHNWEKFNPGTFSVTKTLVNTVELNFTQKSFTIPVTLFLIPVTNDSLTASWKAQFPVVSNPISKVRQYSQAVDLHAAMNNVLDSFRRFVKANENVYGFRITETSTKDTFLIATRFKSDSFPTLQLIYSQINKLENHSAAAGATKSGYPMLNISTLDSSVYSCMVALPINKKLDSKGDVFFIRMVPGRFLTSEVTGGPYTIQLAHRMMDQYFKDFNRMTMAIPFEYLVTDRLKETDTSKWVTRIYGPVY